jgi:hypothetical protein
VPFSFWSAVLEVLAFSECLRYVLCMPDNVQSAMLEILKNIQADVSELKTQLGGLGERAGGIWGSMDRIEALLHLQCLDTAAMLDMMRSIIGADIEHMKFIENDVRLVLEME